MLRSLSEGVFAAGEVSKVPRCGLRCQGGGCDVTVCETAGWPGAGPVPRGDWRGRERSETIGTTEP